MIKRVVVGEAALALRLAASAGVPWLKRSRWCSLVLALVPACSMAPREEGRVDGGGGDVPDAVSPIVFVSGNSGYPEGMVYVTAVRTENDGSHTVTNKLITREEDAVNRARTLAYEATPPGERAPEVLTDEGTGDCLDSSIWLYNLNWAAECPAMAPGRN
jgi:hypothetical protein